MRLISSRWTFFFKRVFPVIWLGGLIVVGGVGLFAPRSNASSLFPFLIVVPVMFCIGLYFMKKLFFGLADQVWDDGNALLVKNRGNQERIALADIKNIGYSQFMNPPIVTLSLRQPTVFGEQILFCPPVRIMPSISPSPIIADLIERVDKARRSHPH